MKKLLFSKQTSLSHWVGDGFPVRTIFSYSEIGAEMSPFLLLDYAGPTEFPPSEQIRGVGEHPHRGFETVTVVYHGEVEHRDSAGGGGCIGPGEVQWMTAASGLVHEEKHGREFAKKGGLFEMVQLWVNLPAQQKKAAPRYQTLTRSQIPEVPIAEGKGLVRVIAGDFGDQRGPAQTFTPVGLWDVRLSRGAAASFSVPQGHTVAVFILSGEVRLSGPQSHGSAELLVLEREGAEFQFTAVEDVKALVLTGAPILEPLVGQGPFVMNSEEEIRQAFLDYRQGRMGKIPST